MSNGNENTRAKAVTQKQAGFLRRNFGIDSLRWEMVIRNARQDRDRIGQISNALNATIQQDQTIEDDVSQRRTRGEDIECLSSIANRFSGLVVRHSNLPENQRQQFWTTEGERNYLSVRQELLDVLQTLNRMNCWKNWHEKDKKIRLGSDYRTIIDDIDKIIRLPTPDSWDVLPGFPNKQRDTIASLRSIIEKMEQAFEEAKEDTPRITLRDNAADALAGRYAQCQQQFEVACRELSARDFWVDARCRIADQEDTIGHRLNALNRTFINAVRVSPRGATDDVVKIGDVQSIADNLRSIANDMRSQVRYWAPRLPDWTQGIHENTSLFMQGIRTWFRRALYAGILLSGSGLGTSVYTKATSSKDPDNRPAATSTSGTSIVTPAPTPEELERQKQAEELKKVLPPGFEIVK